MILKQIHDRFYGIYDDTKEIPDLKIIVPKIRSEVLRNCNLVFSGLVPTNMKLQQSRAYFIAKSLGAEVSQNIMPGKREKKISIENCYRIVFYSFCKLPLRKCKTFADENLGKIGYSYTGNSKWFLIFFL